MLKIKLFPKGKKHQRTFRIVVNEARSKANGKFIDELGFYIPQTKTLNVNQEKLADWVKKGAQITEGVDKLLHPEAHPNKKKKNKIEDKTAETKIETPSKAPEPQPTA